jgi:hypothetical protein
MKSNLLFTAAFAILIALLITCGCSTAVSPLNPDMQNPDIARDAERRGGTTYWGIYEVVIDAETATAEIT